MTGVHTPAYGVHTPTQGDGQMLIAITFGIILVAIALAKLGTFTRSFWIADDATSARLAAVDAEISGRA